MSKAEMQVKLVARLRDYCDSSQRVVSGYLNQRDFALSTLRNMSEAIMELKKETLADECNHLLKEIDKEFSAAPDTKWISAGLDSRIRTGLEAFISDGAHATIRMILMFKQAKELKDILSDLAAANTIEEDGKKKLGDSSPSAKRVTLIYDRLEFPAMEKELIARPTDETLDSVITRVRDATKEYCSVISLPQSENDTLAPFMITSIESLVAANMRLLAKLQMIMQYFGQQ
jgi:hypothetical protein